jgi:DNA-binding transcriptional regulator WhiA
MKLREIADLRIDFTEASLNELCDEYEIRTGTVMSKSGMKHRFTKIMEIAQKIM